MSRLVLVSFLCSALVALVSCSTCHTNADCPQDQCCAAPRFDVLGLVMSCQPYADDGQPCHGSLLTSSCDCAEGLECVEHSGLLNSLVHQEKGVCRKPGTPDPGLIGSLFGKK